MIHAKPSMWTLLSAGAVAVCALPARAEPAPTFNRDVAPIVFRHCAPCHRPGGVGPFSLLMYRDVRARASQIADLTARRVMPPWKPEPGHGAFEGERRLSDEQIAIIRRWAAAGAVEGDVSDRPAPPEWPTGWQLGTPDVVVRMPEPFTLAASGPDVFRTFVLPIPLPRARFVTALEFRPDNPRVVHHANIGVDRSGSSRRLDARDPGPGYSGGMVLDARYPEGHFLGWTPGRLASRMPPDMPWRLDPGSDLVVQLHMPPTGKPEVVQVSVGFYFTDAPPRRTPAALRLGRQTIDIPPGERQQEITDSYRLPVDVDALALQPHAHLLAREVRADATLPNGDVTPLIYIKDWDFRWQDVYRFRDPVFLPRGTRVTMRFTYDNSANNPRNPSRPPRRVVWGENTTDEMGDLYLQVVPRNDRDLAPLAQDFRRKVYAEDVAAYTKLLGEDPANPLRHDALALVHLQAGRAAEAAPHFRDALRLNPDSAPTHYNLGIALSALGDRAAALAEFREAVRLDPTHAQAQNNLGAVLHASGRIGEALERYRVAVDLDPDNAEAQSNLGQALAATGQTREAADHLRRALEMKPDAPAALAALAWIRATAVEGDLRDPVDAVRLGERAVELSGGRLLTALDALAAAYAATGRFDRAVAVAASGVELASRSGALAEAAQMRARVEQYKQRRSP